MSVLGAELSLAVPDTADARPLVPTREVWLAWLTSRLWIGLFVYLGHLSHPFLKKIPGGWEGVPSWWLNPWTTYDSEHFMNIAAHGYTEQTSPFFPLLPLVLHPFAADFNLMALWGVLVCNLAFGAALWLLYDLTRRDYGTATARRTLWIAAFFPSGAFGMAVYSESLFLLLGVAAFWYARRVQWGGVGVFATLAALTRNAGPLLTLALSVEWWMQRQRGLRPPLWGLFMALLPALAFVGMQLYFRARFGGALSSVSVQALYGREFQFPLLPIWRDVVEFVSGRHADIGTLLNWLATVSSFVLAWRWRREQPRADAVLLCGVMLMQLIWGRISPPYTNSSLRYALSTWPFLQLVSLQLVALQKGALAPRSAAQHRFRLGYVACTGLFLTAILSYCFGQKVFLG